MARSESLGSNATVQPSRFESQLFFSGAESSLPALQADANMGLPYMKRLAMTTIVGIFDNAQDMDQAVTRLASAGFDDTVYDEAIVAQEQENTGPVVPVAVGPVLAPGVVAAEGSRRIEPDLPTIGRSFKALLAGYNLPDDVLNAYAQSFYHKGKFVVVRTDAERAEQVSKILGECGATRVNRHG